MVTIWKGGGILNIPFQIYDFIAVLFPATLLLVILQIEDPRLYFPTGDAGGLAIMLVVTYLIGQVLSVISGWLENLDKNGFILKKRKLNKKDNKENSKEMATRVLSVELGAEIHQKIIEATKDVYGMATVPEKGGELFNLIYSPVQGLMGKRDTFLALANMMRACVVVSCGYSFYLIGKIGILAIHKQTINTSAILLFVFIFGFYAFRDGYLKNKLLSEEIPLYAFLAWYSQQKLGNKSSTGGQQE